MGNDHRYGTLVVVAEEGRWYWDDVLHAVAFVPRGCQNATYEASVRPRGRTLPEALRHIALMMEEVW